MESDMKPSRWGLALAFGAVSAAAWAQVSAASGNSTVYRCPGPPVLYTDALSAKEAKDKNCRTIEGAPITVMQSQKPRPVAATAAPASRAEAKVDPSEQKARDTDARRILEAELKREEERLAELQKEYNNGEPERRGDERNYQKYLDRVADLKASIGRKESDIAAIKRELAKVQ
jgi:hypothetical protein